jgi:RNA polymerase sigma-70 factor (ECF subfamily)
MTDSDHELMRRCRQGDSAAFDRLVRRWEQPVNRILLRLAGSRTEPGCHDPESARNDIDDLSQEVFVRVLSARHRYRNRHAFSTWLYRIVLNVTRDAARRRRTRRKLRNNHHPVAAAETPPEAVSRQEIEQQIAEAVSALPDDLREPLVLRHFGDLTFAEVARVTGAPLGTVKSRVRTALLKLRTELKNHGIDERELEP